MSKKISITMVKYNAAADSGAATFIVRRKSLRKNELLKKHHKILKKYLHFFKSYFPNIGGFSVFRTVSVPMHRKNLKKMPNEVLRKRVFENGVDTKISAGVTGVKTVYFRTKIATCCIL